MCLVVFRYLLFISGVVFRSSLWFRVRWFRCLMFRLWNIFALVAIVICVLVVISAILRFCVGRVFVFSRCRFCFFGVYWFCSFFLWVVVVIWYWVAIFFLYRFISGMRGDRSLCGFRSWLCRFFGFFVICLLEMFSCFWFLVLRGRRLCIDTSWWILVFRGVLRFLGFSDSYWRLRGSFCVSSMCVYVKIYVVNLYTCFYIRIFCWAWVDID